MVCNVLYEKNDPPWNCNHELCSETKATNKESIYGLGDSNTETLYLDMFIIRNTDAPSLILFKIDIPEIISENEMLIYVK